MKKLQIIVCASLLLPCWATAAIIGPDDFGPNARIVDYDNLGWPDRYRINSDVIDGDLYQKKSELGAEFLYKVDSYLCMSNDCLALGTRDTAIITLGTAVNRAGIWIRDGGGAESALSAFDAAGNLIGTDDVGTFFFDVGYFFGFESLSTPIARVEITAHSGGGGMTLVGIDDFTSETVVPIPAAAWLFGSGLLGLVGIARKKST